MRKSFVLGSVLLAAIPALAAEHAPPEGWRTYRDAQTGFSIDYPREFKVDTNHDYAALGPGMDIHGVAFMVPSNVAAGTNLSADSYLSVEIFPRAMDCTPKAFLADPVSMHSVKQDGRDWFMATSSDAGAGNIYDETVYTLAGTAPCIGVRYFIHSGNIANYDPGAVHAFDRKSLVATFDKIRATLVPPQATTEGAIKGG